MKNLKKWFFRLILGLIPNDLISEYLLTVLNVLNHCELIEFVKCIPSQHIRESLSGTGLIKRWHEEEMEKVNLRMRESMKESGFNEVCFKNVEIIRQDGSVVAKKFVLIMVLRNNDVEKRKAEWLNADSEVAKIEYSVLRDRQTQIIFYDNKNNKIHEETRYAVITRFDNEQMAFAHYQETN